MDNVWTWDDPLFSQNIDEIITNAANRWEENHKNQNQINGENRAESELAFRDKIVSVKSEKIGKSEKYLWITVNPIKGTELQRIIRCIQKMYQKKWIDKFAYVYETTEQNHMHSHGLIKATYEYKRAYKELSNSVKDICNVSNTHCFKCIAVPEDVAMQKMEYMLGKKKLTKLKGVDITTEWRTKEMLKPIYNSKEPLTLLGSSETENLPTHENYEEPDL